MLMKRLKSPSRASICFFCCRDHRFENAAFAVTSAVWGDLKRQAKENKSQNKFPAGISKHGLTSPKINPRGVVALIGGPSRPDLHSPAVILHCLPWATGPRRRSNLHLTTVLGSPYYAALATPDHRVTGKPPAGNYLLRCFNGPLGRDGR